MNIKLKNVRLSFPDLFQPKSFQGGEPKYGATFLLDKVKDKAQIDELRNVVMAVANEKWANKIPKGVKYCIMDGDEKEYDGYAGNLYIHATSKKRPGVVARDLSPLTDGDGMIYAGCRVNCSMEIWAQDNDWGKRINATLNGVQFARDDEAFGAKPFVAADEFEPLEAGASETDEPVRQPQLSDSTIEELPF